MDIRAGAIAFVTLGVSCMLECICVPHEEQALAEQPKLAPTKKLIFLTPDGTDAAGCAWIYPFRLIANWHFESNNAKE